LPTTKQRARRKTKTKYTKKSGCQKRKYNLC